MGGLLQWSDRDLGAVGVYSGKEGTLPDAQRLTTSFLSCTKTPQCANIIQSIKKAFKDRILHSACRVEGKHRAIFCTFYKLMIVLSQSKIKA